MTKSLKKEQARLLRLEKEIVALSAGIATLTGGANAKELLGEPFADHAAKLTDAYLNLVQTVQAAHDAMNERALAAGIQLLEARGTPKDPPLEAVKSILGLG